MKILWTITSKARNTSTPRRPRSNENWRRASLRNPRLQRKRFRTLLRRSWTRRTLTTLSWSPTLSPRSSSPIPAAACSVGRSPILWRRILFSLFWLARNLLHMSKAHSFLLPDFDYIDDLDGLLDYLGEKVFSCAPLNPLRSPVVAFACAAIVASMILMPFVSICSMWAILASITTPYDILLILPIL